MQSFHHSRVRILFEVLCALAIAGSCVGAWQQTGASALLGAAAVTALYGLVHAFDMARGRPTAVADPKPTERAMEQEAPGPARQEAFVSPVWPEQHPAADSVAEVVKAEPAAPRPTRAAKTKAPRKPARRRTSVRDEKVTELPSAPVEVIEVTPPEDTNATEVVPPQEPQVTEPAPSEDTNVTRLAPPENVPAAPPPAADEAAPVPLTPLFDPKPFVRQQRTAFGRKS